MNEYVGLSKKKLNSYLDNKNHKKFEINTSLINAIKIIPNERKKLLQLADCCCSALFQALKYNDKTHFEYIKIIKKKLYNKKNNLISYGLKLVPSDSNATQLKKLLEYLDK